MRATARTGDRREGGSSATREPSVAPATLRARTHARLSELGVRPSRELGQNFLVDERYLDVVEAAAELGPGDVVLEVGGGLGVLSERLAARVGHLHVVEVDRLLASALEDSLAPFENASLHRADAVRLDLAALIPSPTKLVANLPYGVAATILLKSIEELPAADLWVAMVQREVAERLAANPGSRVYGATSVLAQLACEVRVHRRVPRAAFVPAPNVDSAVVVLRRRTCAPPAVAVRRLVRGAFAHRRKTLAGSLSLVERGPDDLRERVHAALVALGQRADARAERLTPQEFLSLSTLLARPGAARGEGARGERRAEGEGAPGEVRAARREGGPAERRAARGEGGPRTPSAASARE